MGVIADHTREESTIIMTGEKRVIEEETMIVVTGTMEGIVIVIVTAIMDAVEEGVTMTVVIVAVTVTLVVIVTMEGGVGIVEAVALLSVGADLATAAHHRDDDIPITIIIS